MAYVNGHRCDACGVSMSPESKFCKNCGRPRVKVENFCSNPECEKHINRHPFSKDDRYCDNCGGLTEYGAEIKRALE